MSDENTPNDDEQAAESAAPEAVPEPAAEEAAPVTHPGAVDDTPASQGTPWHIWVIGILALAFNAYGAFLYVGFQYGLSSVVSGASAEQIQFMNDAPIWSDAAWAIAVWAAVFASLSILLRKAWALWLFGISLIAMLVNYTDSYILRAGVEISESPQILVSVVVTLIIAALLIYSRNMAKAGVLR